MEFIQEIFNNLNANENRITVLSDSSEYSYSFVRNCVLKLNTKVKQITDRSFNRGLLLMSNSLEWLITDLYLIYSGITEVCIPLSFNIEQAQNLLTDIEVIFVDNDGYSTLNKWKTQGLNFNKDIVVIQVHLADLKDMSGSTTICQKENRVLKIIHTSGSTNTPKGVMISSQGLDVMLKSLHNRLPIHVNKKYFSVVPLSLLIEQVAIYLTLLRKGDLVLPGEGYRLLGDGNSTAEDIYKNIVEIKPSGMSIPPSVAKVLYNISIDKNIQAGDMQKLFGQATSPYFSCGGAPVSPEILAHLVSIGVTIYEGYGLSENSSVVSINTPDHNKIGTVGRPLDHTSVKLSSENELLIKSASLFLGYSNNEDTTMCDFDEDGWLKTGDIATIDEEGYLKIIGRKKSMLITNNGRNIAPEWIEEKIKECPLVLDAVLFMNKNEMISALLLKENVDVPDESIQKSVEYINQDHFFNIENFIIRPYKDCTEYFTISGKPNRTKIKNEFN